MIEQSEQRTIDDRSRQGLVQVRARLNRCVSTRARAPLLLSSTPSQAGRDVTALRPLLEAAAPTPRPCDMPYQVW